MRMEKLFKTGIFMQRLRPELPFDLTLVQRTLSKLIDQYHTNLIYKVVSTSF